MKTFVTIPGTVTAEYEDDGTDNRRINRIVFTPAVSEIGYIGPPAEVFSSDHPTAQWDGGGELEVTNNAGPFWVAMRAFLDQGGVPEINWEEDPG